MSEDTRQLRALRDALNRRVGAFGPLTGTPLREVIRASTDAIAALEAPAPPAKCAGFRCAGWIDSDGRHHERHLREFDTMHEGNPNAEECVCVCGLPYSDHEQPDPLASKDHGIARAEPCDGVFCEGSADSYRLPGPGNRHGHRTSDHVSPPDARGGNEQSPPTLAPLPEEAIDSALDAIADEGCACNDPSDVVLLEEHKCIAGRCENAIMLLRAAAEERGTRIAELVREVERLEVEKRRERATLHRVAEELGVLWDGDTPIWESVVAVINNLREESARANQNGFAAEQAERERDEARAELAALKAENESLRDWRANITSQLCRVQEPVGFLDPAATHREDAFSFPGCHVAGRFSEPLYAAPRPPREPDGIGIIRSSPVGNYPYWDSDIGETMRRILRGRQSCKVALTVMDEDAQPVCAASRIARLLRELAALKAEREAAQAQEPVGTMDYGELGNVRWIGPLRAQGTKLYAAPRPSREPDAVVTLTKYPYAGYMVGSGKTDREAISIILAGRQSCKVALTVLDDEAQP